MVVDGQQSSHASLVAQRTVSDGESSEQRLVGQQLVRVPIEELTKGMDRDA
jgi:hypothetical protein